MIVNPLSSAYGAAASWRRRWYARDPARVRRLTQPVVSVGNLRAGGSGKTPVVACLARVLLAHGERPSILTRGYGRRRSTEVVTVVSNGTDILADIDRAGDEPLMLARALAGVPVLVGASRFESGRFAEQHFGVTVHLLDDGFQHVALARDADLLLVDESDLRERVLPVGRLREPLANATAADALLVTAADAGAVDRLADALGVPTSFRVRRSISAARFLGGDAQPIPAQKTAFAFAGIARADRFFADLSRAGWRLAGSASFRDHYRFTQHDLDHLVAAARGAGADLLLTTEKDAVRLEALDTAIPIGVVPLTAVVEPPEVFSAWLMDRIHARRR